MRAAILVTGSELVRGDRNDLNGPYLARSLLGLGLEPAEVRIVGDDPHELAAALREGLASDLLVVSGGLGPTHDDRTVALLAEAAGVPLELDTTLEEQITARMRSFAASTRQPQRDLSAGIRKQATIPRGALVVGLAGTAPALALEHARGVAVVLPGPPRELQELWPAALKLGPLQQRLAALRPRERRVLRFYGAGESVVAEALADAGGEPEGVEVTICARDFEVHVDLFVRAGAENAAASLTAAFTEPLRDYLFAESEASIEQLVLERCRQLSWSLATAESCTGGLVAARLTAPPGASAAFLGSIVAYANTVKQEVLGVSADTLARCGAVSPETAAAMAQGARARLGADLAVAITGIAGPDGGSADKPVGLVYLATASPAGTLARTLELPGDRETIRLRATVAALHLLHRALAEP